ncbi:MAG: hypothetical protein K2N63_15030 [Lachnospiraceae bacterium]|nr:hypothetical protein [Lachnospiraceae bacterium]
MRVKRIRFILLFLVMIEMIILSACNSKNSEPKIETESERHAFWVANELIFIADIPVDWRYILYPIYDYGYYERFGKYEGMDEQWHYIEFVGKGKNDGMDDFFVILANAFWDWLDFTYKPWDGTIYSDRKGTKWNSIPFSFQDGTLGKWETKILDESVYYMDDLVTFYRGYIYDMDENYCIRLNMLKDEYDANEQDIVKFVQSACFRTSDLGISKEKNILKRELITLHIWNAFIQLSLDAPEGAELGHEMRYHSDGSVETSLYYIYLDKDKENYIEIEPDQDGQYIDLMGDFHYDLNVEDFTETVYEIPKNDSIAGGYYFPRKNVAVWVNVDEKNTKMREYVNKVVHSIKFE